MIKAYLDTNIFLTYLNVETSNSELVIELADQGAYAAVVSFHTIDELMHNIKSRYLKCCRMDVCIPLVDTRDSFCPKRRDRCVKRSIF